MLGFVVVVVEVYFCVSVQLAYMSVEHVCILCSQSPESSVSDPQRLELQMVMSCHVCTGNQA